MKWVWWLLGECGERHHVYCDGDREATSGSVRCILGRNHQGMHMHPWHGAELFWKRLK